MYVPLLQAPEELREVFDEEQSRIRDRYHGQEVVALFGGLAAQIHFKGIGLTPLGKEKEARVGQVLADATGELLGALRKGLAVLDRCLPPVPMD